MEYTFALIFFYKIFESWGNFNQIIEPLAPFLLITIPVLGGGKSVCLKDFLIASDFTDLTAFPTTSASSWKGMTGIASFLPSEIIFLLVRRWYLNDCIAKWGKEIIPCYSPAYEILDGFIWGLIIWLPQFASVTLKVKKQASCPSMF